MNHTSCTPTQKKLCKDKKCDQCFRKSFLSHPRSKFWSPENTETPRSVSKSSHSKYKFICDNEECAHTFESALHKITNCNCWCPYCCNNSRKLCPDAFTDVGCDVCFSVSFASNPRSEFWSDKNTEQPWECMPGTHKKYIFNCPNPECLHEFETSLGHISTNNRWCPYCAVPSKRLCEDTSPTGCLICRAKTMASHPRAKFWHPKNKKKPEQVFLNSHDRYKFICGGPNGCKAVFETKMFDITGKGVWCPVCRHKTEAKLFEWLRDNRYDVKRQAKFEWCRNFKTGHYLPFDFVIGNILIELDGPQHFKQVSNWQSPQKTQLYDRRKERLANQNGYSIIRLLQEDVLIDRPASKWKSLLKKSISNKREEPTISLLSFPGYDSREVVVEYEVCINFVRTES